jgi:hypothetical protein
MEFLPYVLLVLGAVIMTLIKLQSAWFRTDYKSSIFLKKNLLAGIINILIGMGFIWAGVKISWVIYGVDVNLLFWMFMGAAGLWLWRKGMKRFKNETNNIIENEAKS